MILPPEQLQSKICTITTVTGVHSLIQTDNTVPRYKSSESRRDSQWRVELKPAAVHCRFPAHSTLPYSTRYFYNTYHPRILTMPTHHLIDWLCVVFCVSIVIPCVHWHEKGRTKALTLQYKRMLYRHKPKSFYFL